MDDQGKGRRANRLAGEKSPYLLQHAANPVDWYPWGNEAFTRAKDLNRPIFLSIGYATCHWCHVMERESFEDREVARLMNEAFVAVKVDREERPDLDHFYMSVCQGLTGSGGWPLTIVMTPEGKPFFAGTYFPRESRYGRVGMTELVPRLDELWREKHGDVLRTSEGILAALKDAAAGNGRKDIDAAAVLKKAAGQLASHYDGEQGGFGRAPKFPHPDFLRLLLRMWRRRGDKAALAMVEKSLTSMRLGGIYDHVGFGFHRYSTDEGWLLPHFEKMLYDQALLAITYIEAWQATGGPLFRRTAREIFAYVLRDLRRPEGAFCCAEDADSEGEEGLFYLWGRDEARALLDDEEFSLFTRTFNVREGGNFTDELGRPSERNILFCSSPIPGADGAEGRILEQARLKLLAAREKRVRPLLDDKVITDWNGLIIAALARGAAAFGDDACLEAAEGAAAFVLETMKKPDGTLLHRWRGGEAALPAHVDDYAFLVWGLLELYQAAFRPRYLAEAAELTKKMVALFWDESEGGLFFSSKDEKALPLRQKIVDDGSYPSGNSVAAVNLLRLGRLTGEAFFEEKAAALLEASGAGIEEHPTASTHLLGAVDMAHGTAEEIVITGGEGRDELLSLLRRHYLPNATLHVLDEDAGRRELLSLAPFLTDFDSAGSRARAFLCRGQRCETAVEEPAALEKLLFLKKP